METGKTNFLARALQARRPKTVVGENDWRLKTLSIKNEMNAEILDDSALSLMSPATVQPSQNADKNLSVNVIN